MCRNVTPKKPVKSTAPAPRLSTMFLDEHAANRVKKARESIFNASMDLDDEDDREPPELGDGTSSPLPPELVKASARGKRGKSRRAKRVASPASSRVRR